MSWSVAGCDDHTHWYFSHQPSCQCQEIWSRLYFWFLTCAELTSLLHITALPRNKKRTWNLSLHSSGVKCTYKASISSRATCLNKNMCINICIVFKIRKKKKVCLQTWGIFLKIRYFCTSLFGIVNGNMLFTYTFCRVTNRALLVNTALCHQHLIFFFLTPHRFSSVLPLRTIGGAVLLLLSKHCCVCWTAVTLYYHCLFSPVVQTRAALLCSFSNCFLRQLQETFKNI